MTPTPDPAPVPPVVYLDSSALVRRYLADRQRPLVVSTMAAADVWVTSALARSEVMVTIHRAAVDRPAVDAAWAAVRDDWDALWEVPVDGRCLARATEIGARFGITIATATHLAAADRLPSPVGFLTFDRRQIPAAAELGLRVISPAA